MMSLTVTYQHEPGIDVYATERRVPTIGGATRTVVNDDDNIYQRRIAVSDDDYAFDSHDVYARIVMVADGLNPNTEVHPAILMVTHSDGGTTTRDFSMALYNGISEMVDDVTGSGQPPMGDHDEFEVLLIDGTEFKVTIERTRGPRD